LLRYQQAAEWAQADTIVRITGDCPFIDPTIITTLVSGFQGSFGYFSNTLVRCMPRGLDVELFSRALLNEANALATTPHEREHVTPWMREGLRSLHFPALTTTLAHHRWCLDTPEDYAWCQRIAAVIDCTPPFPPSSVLYALALSRPDLANYEPVDR
jgi:spore coat polysaccharide biosynthesis protein SpsF